MIDHISTGRSRVKSTAAKVVETHLGLKTDDGLEEDDIVGKLELHETNKNIIQTALDANNFVYREYNNRDVSRRLTEFVPFAQLFQLTGSGRHFPECNDPTSPACLLRRRVL